MTERETLDISAESARLLCAIRASESLQALVRTTELPEPYDDRGFFMAVYAEEDYKEALCDIVLFMESGLRVYYDRNLERGETHRRDFAAKCKSLHCRCVVFYLSRRVWGDPTFWEAARTVYRSHIPYVSVNLPTDGIIESGAQMLAAGAGGALAAEDRRIAEILFADEITYIPGSFSVAEKRESLLKAHSAPAFYYSVRDGYAVLDHIRDNTETEAIIPERVLLGEREYTVQAIAPSAFADCTRLQTVEIPATVQTVGVGDDTDALTFGNVFYNCKSLTQIVFPPSVKTLMSGCFLGCTSLRRLILNDGLSFCGNADALFLCGGGDEEDEDEERKLEELRLPDTVRRISKHKYIARVGEGYFSVRLPRADNVTGYEANPIEAEYTVSPGSDPSFLRGLLRVERVVFDPAWRGVLHGDMERCRNVKSVVLSPHTDYLDGTFRKCDALTDVTMPAKLRHIYEDTFAECVSLEEIRLPENVRFVHGTAFRGCVRLHTLVCDSKYGKKLLRSAQPFYDENAVGFSGRLRYGLRCVFLLPWLFLRHPVRMIRKMRRKSFLALSDIQTVYAPQKMRIPGFLRVASDRDGYRKYVRVSAAKNSRP